jgi:hypothetical protein
MSKAIYNDRDYFDTKFKTINDQFGDVIVRLDKINNNKIPDIENRVGCLEKKNEIKEEIEKNWWRRHKRFLERAGVIIAFLSLIYMSWKDRQITKDAKKNTELTNQILEPERIKRGIEIE